MTINFEKNMSKFVRIFIILLVIFSFALIMINNGEEETVLTSTQTGLSNKKIGWGIKRNDNHAQPDLGSQNRKVLESNNGIAIGNAEDKCVYLTFDEGYEAGYTPEILRVLKENDVKATFFITAHFLNTQPDLVKQMIDENHIVRKSHLQSSVYARYNRRKNKFRSYGSTQNNI